MWYWCHNHFNLVVVIEVRYLPVSSYRWDTSFCVCIVFFVVFMSFSGLHFVILNLGIWDYFESMIH